MDKKERYVLFIILFMVVVSIFLMLLRGRYQISTMGNGWPISHDTWTGRVYLGGTNSKYYDRSQEAKETNAQEQKRPPRDLLEELKRKKQ